MTTAIIYTRIATEAQSEEYTTELQADLCRQYAKDQFGITEAEEVTDTCDGENLDRPGLNRLRKMVEQGEVNRIFVASGSRLIRNRKQALQLLQEISRHGAEIYFCGQGEEGSSLRLRLEMENLVRPKYLKRGRRYQKSGDRTP